MGGNGPSPKGQPAASQLNLWTKYYKWSQPSCSWTPVSLILSDVSPLNVLTIGLLGTSEDYGNFGPQRKLVSPIYTSICIIAAVTEKVGQFGLIVLNITYPVFSFSFVRYHEKCNSKVFLFLEEFETTHWMLIIGPKLPISILTWEKKM